MIGAIARSFRPRAPAAAAGDLVFAIGDVHGCRELLAALMDGLVEDVAATRAEAGEDVRSVVVFLGDYVDRGPDSSGVLDALVGLDRGQFDDMRFLRGNHEDTLLEFLDDASAGARWCAFGGDATLKSYGIAAPAPDASSQEWEGARKAFARALPEEHVAFLRDLPYITTSGDYAFVHAGVRPGVLLAEQSLDDLLWIRDEFLDDDSRLEKVIVHGHTPEPEPFHSFRRIGVDTGAYASGVLTAVRLYGQTVSFLQSTMR